MGRDSDHRCQHLRRHSIGHIAVHHTFEPTTVCGVPGGIRSEGVYQDIHIGKNHPRPSIRSRRAALLSRSTPGRTPPPAREVGRVTRLRRLEERDCARTSRSPCSIRAVNVSSRRAASRLARSRRASSSRTVVLICLDIPYGMSGCQML
jgi:hypothetical protein